MGRANLQTTAPNECGDVHPDEIQAAKRITAALSAAVRRYLLYPNDHSISQKGIQLLKDSLAGIFQYEDPFRIDVSRDHLLYKKINVYKPTTKNDPIVAPLFRDGILWIAISTGVELCELEIFLKLLGDNSSITDVAESDLVTALWRAKLPHLRYEAINGFWESQPKFDFGYFALGHPGEAPLKYIRAIEAPAQNTNDSPQLETEKSDDKQKFFKLTTTESQLLKKLISKNTETDDIEDVLTILMVTLKDQQIEAEFIDILDFLKLELKVILADAQFNLAHTLLERISRLKCGPSHPFLWRNKLIHDFLFKISSDGTLEVLETGLLKLKPADSRQAKAFKDFMLKLEAQAVYTLAGLLLKIPSRDLKILLMDIIRALSLKDLTPLEQLLDHSSPLLVKKLITILAHLRNGRSKELLLKLMDHPSDEVRQNALFWLIKGGELPTDKVRALLEDPSANVRAQVFRQISLEKNQIYERMLRRYIEEGKFRISDRAFLMNCYQALGKCASHESVAFLEKQLFDWKYLPLIDLRKSLHRQGAALALIELQTPDAKQIVNKASRSFYPPIRRAHKKALEFKLGVK
jgi:hypothetical protein